MTSFVHKPAGTGVPPGVRDRASLMFAPIPSAIYKRHSD